MFNNTIFYSSNVCIIDMIKFKSFKLLDESLSFFDVMFNFIDEYNSSGYLYGHLLQKIANRTERTLLGLLGGFFSKTTALHFAVLIEIFFRSHFPDSKD